VPCQECPTLPQAEIKDHLGQSAAETLFGQRPDLGRGRLRSRLRPWRPLTREREDLCPTRRDPELGVL
jgi:hypothetical protein